MADRTVRVRLEAAVHGFTAAMAQAQASTRAFGSRFGRMARENSEAMRTMGTVALAAGGTILAGFGKAAGAAANFEAEMNRVGALTGAVGEEFDSLGALAQELGRTTMFSASEAAQGMGFLAMAGFQTNEILEAMPSTLDLAAAGQMDLARAADIASNVLTGYGKEATEVGEVNDVIAATATSANTSVEQMGQAMSMVAPIANSSGLAFEETAAAIGMLGDAGIQGTRAGTTLRQMLASLESPTGPAAAAIEQLGIKTHNAAGELLPLHDIIGQLEGQSASTGEVMEIFGNRAGPGLAALMEMGSDKLQEFTGDLEESGGAAEEMADRQMEGLKGAMTELGSATEGMMIAFGSQLTPALESAADGLNSVVTGMAEMSDPAQKAVTWVGGLSGVVLTAGGGFLMLAPRIVATRDALARMGPAAQGAARGLGRLGRLAGSAAVLWAIDSAASALRDTLADSLAGPVQSVDDLTLAFEGLAATGGVPDSVAGSLDGIGTAIDRLDAGGVGGFRDDVTSFLGNFGSVGAGVGGMLGLSVQEMERFEERLDNLDQTLAGFVSTGNTEAVGTALERMGISVAEARELFPGYAKALDEAELASDGMAGATENLIGAAEGVVFPSDLAEGIEDTGEAAEEAVDPIDAYADAIERVAGVHLDAESAQIRFLDALQDIIDLEDDASTSLDINTEAGRRNREMIVGAAEAALSHATSLMEEGASAEEATGVLDQHITNLKEELRQAGFAEEQINDLTEAYGLVPEDILTEVLLDDEDANARLAALTQTRDVRINARVSLLRTDYGRQAFNDATAEMSRFQHDGGWAGKGKTRRMHSGGFALKSDEVGPVVLQRGEFVVRREVAQANSGLLESLNGSSGGPVAVSAGGGSSSVSVSLPVMLDGREIGRSAAVIDAMSGEVRSRSLHTAGTGPF